MKKNPLLDILNPPNRQEYLDTMLPEQEPVEQEPSTQETLSKLAQAKLPVPPEQEVEQVNNQAGSPYQEEKQKPSKDLDSDNYSQDFRDIINQYKKQINTPEESNWTDHLADTFAGLHNIVNYGQGSQQRNLDINNFAKQQQAKQSAQQNKLTSMEKLAKLMQSYESANSKNTMSPYEQAKIELEKQKVRKPKEPSFEEKENIKQQNKLKSENIKAKKEAKNTLSDLDTQLEKIRRAKKLMKDLSNDTFTDTGPLDQFVAGSKSEGQQLRQAFNDLSLEKMSKLFKGMSKAIDSDAERKMFEQSQASLSNYPDVNMKILDDMEKGVLSLKRKNMDFYNSYDKEGNQVEAEEKVSEAPTKVEVVFEDGRRGRIDSDKVEAFTRKYPTAKVLK